MLPRQHRLKHMKDFDILFKEGRFVGGQYITMKVWRIDPDKYPRRQYAVDDLKIGFVVSKKVHKSAVKRNRLKRQMREVVRLLLKDRRVQSGYVLAVMAKATMLEVSYQEIERDMISVMRRARVLK